MHKKTDEYAADCGERRHKLPQSATLLQTWLQHQHLEGEYVLSKAKHRHVTTRHDRTRNININDTSPAPADRGKQNIHTTPPTHTTVHTVYVCRRKSPQTPTRTPSHTHAKARTKTPPHPHEDKQKAQYLITIFHTHTHTHTAIITHHARWTLLIYKHFLPYFSSCLALFSPPML
jgi:hypothetical protein